MDLRALTADRLRSMHRRIDLELARRPSLRSLPDDVLALICARLDARSRLGMLRALLGVDPSLVQRDLADCTGGGSFIRKAFVAAAWEMRLSEVIEWICACVHDLEHPSPDARYHSTVCVFSDWSPFHGDRVQDACIARIRGVRSCIIDRGNVARAARDALKKPFMRLTMHSLQDDADHVDGSFFWVAVVNLCADRDSGRLPQLFRLAQTA